jgi:hypothetical protein
VTTVADTTYDRLLAGIRERIEGPQDRSEAATALAKLNGRVLKTLEHATAELRGYLDRPEPNVAGALGRLRDLEDLIRDLGGPVYLPEDAVFASDGATR